MKLRTLILSTVIGLALAGAAWATASVPVTVTVTSPPSTVVTCIPPSGGFVAPVAVGIVICTATALPSGGSYSLSLSGTDAALFAPSGMNVVVGASPLTVIRNYVFTVTSNP